jgi:hypothetical protein
MKKIIAITFLVASLSSFAINHDFATVTGTGEISTIEVKAASKQACLNKLGLIEAKLGDTHLVLHKNSCETTARYGERELRLAGFPIYKDNKRELHEGTIVIIRK